MTKLKSVLVCTAILAAASASAQQLPNVGFSEWKTECGNTEAFGYTNDMLQRPGIEPYGWNGSSVHQNVLLTVKEELVFRLGDLDADHSNAVRLINKFVGAFGIGSVAPGFINFGTPWVQAEFDVNNCDGGTYGGMEFAYSPDELQLEVKRIDSNDEVSSVIAYLWTGHTSSMVGGIAEPTNPRTDVDRALMGRAESLEGSDAQTIAKIDYSFTSTDGEWQTLNIPFTYTHNDMTHGIAPEMLNVIVCSGDYWTRSNLKEGTELYVDNVKLIYHSRLSSLNVFHTPLEGFDPDIYEYYIDECIPMTDEVFVEPFADGIGASINYEWDTEKPVCKIIVSNVGDDNDGLSEHVYTLTFKTPAATETTEFDGKLTIMMGGELLTPEEGMPASLIIESTEDSDLCTITLPDFTLDLGNGPTPLGDIVVTGVNKTIDEETGDILYNGSAEGYQLLGGALVADIELTGVCHADSVVNFDINVLWMGQEILCHFFSGSSALSTISTDDNSRTEVYDLRGIRVNEDNMPAGVYIRRQGEKTVKFIVK